MMNISSASAGSAILLGKKYEVFKPDISLWKAPTAEDIAQMKQEEARRAAQDAEANDPVRRAAYDAVKAHTVIRVNGQIAAVVYRDG